MKMWIALRPVALGPVDSRSYIYALPIRSANDLPGDFDFPDDLREFSHGVFLPRAEPDWLGRTPYAPRVVLLSEDSLVIFAHPASGEATHIIPFRELQFVEHGHFLLVGWISFVSSQGVRELNFNTRTSPPVEELLSMLSKQCARPFNILDNLPCVSFGGALDIKFQNAELAALDRDERVLIRFFNPTREKRRRVWGLFPIESHEPADYLAVTNRRVLWITERNRNAYARYGSIVRSAPLGNIIDVSVDGAGPECCVVCRFKGGASWDLMLPADQSGAAAAFADRALSVISLLLK
jgi:hypothetical protein